MSNTKFDRELKKAVSEKYYSPRKGLNILTGYVEKYPILKDNIDPVSLPANILKNKTSLRG
jgi:hypothetical protein